MFAPSHGQNPEFGVSNQAVAISNKLKHGTVPVSVALVTVGGIMNFPCVLILC